MEQEKKRVHSFRVLTVIFGAVALILLLSAVLMWWIPPDSAVTTYGMGEYIRQSVWGKNREEATKEAANEIALLENQISWSVIGSEIERLNRGAGKDFLQLDAEVTKLLQMGREIAEQSGGAFDLTAAPLTRLWGFDEGKNRVPESEIIGQILPDIGYQNLLFEQNGDDVKAVLKYRSSAVDLGMVAQGAACDAAVAVYREQGVSAARVSIGGSTGFFGGLMFGAAWKIAVFDQDGELGELSLQEGFVSTASNRDRAFEQDGKTYHAHLDPRTGYPTESGVASVTVTAESGALSDALSEACFVLGYQDGEALLEKYGASAVWVMEDKRVYVSQELVPRFKLIAEGYRWEEA